ncbi:MAG: NTP transferase domain-containing protein [Ignavibacteria bacterium]|nr:NTP transferase domain-containing protein [Ignavibacteria bacterium]MBI3766371.1 NTP transferase domain-containing protein [Ignavibacteriales bacterium]
MQPNIAILAGGISSRMKKPAPISPALDPSLVRDAERKSKAMIGVGGGYRPFLDYVLHNIECAGYKSVVIIVGEMDTSIREYYEHNSATLFQKLNISYAVQKIPPGRVKPMGAADALLEGLKAMPGWKGQHFTACNCDNLYSVHALRVLLEDTHDNAMIDYDRSALQFDQARFAQFSVIQKNAQGFLENIIEKPSLDEIARAADARGRIGVSMNIFRFTYDQIMPFLEKVPIHQIRQEKELPTAVTLMVAKHPRSMFTIPLSEHVPDLSSQSDIVEVQNFLRVAYPDFHLKGS